MGELVELSTFTRKPREKVISDTLTVASFQEGKKLFLLNCRVKNLSKGTVAWYGKKLDDFENFLLANYGGVVLPGITADALRDFICHMQKKENGRDKSKMLSTYTIAGTVRVLRVFFHFLSEEGYLSSDPCEKIQIPKVQKKIIKPLSETEIQCLLSLPDVSTFTGLRDYLIMLIFLDTGLRLSELVGLKVCDVDWERYAFKVLGKGNKEREVPFGAHVARALIKFLRRREKVAAACENIFVSQHGRVLHTRHVQSIIYQYGRRAGIENLHPHKFRHTTALQWIKSGGDVLSLQRMLGHSSLDMVKHYVFLASGDVTMKHRQFGLVDKMNLKERNVSPGKSV